MPKNNTSFKPGEKRVIRKKGIKQTKTLIKESVGLTGWDALCDFVKDKGAYRYIEVMASLKGRDYIVAYNAMTEYVKPKLARTEHAGDPDNPIHLTLDM